MSVENVLSRILKIEHGFQHIIDGTNEILSSNSKEQCFKYGSVLKPSCKPILLSA